MKCSECQVGSAMAKGKAEEGDLLQGGEGVTELNRIREKFSLRK